MDKYKEIGLEWNVIYGDFNSGKIEVYDIFDHYGFLIDCREVYKMYGDDKEKFEKEIKWRLGYHFRFKCEWEVIVSHWPPAKKNSRFKDRKIDAYTQIDINWNRFIDYLWGNRKKLESGEY